MSHLFVWPVLCAVVLAVAGAVGFGGFHFRSIPLGTVNNVGAARPTIARLAPDQAGNNRTLVPPSTAPRRVIKEVHGTGRMFVALSLACAGFMAPVPLERVSQTSAAENQNAQQLPGFERNAATLGSVPGPELGILSGLYRGQYIAMLFHAETVAQQHGPRNETTALSDFRNHTGEGRTNA